MQVFGSFEQEALFEKGDLVEGKVMKILSSNQVMVRLSGVELVALTDTKLLEGQKIVGRVEKVDPHIIISLLRGESTKELKTAALMRLLMPAKAPAGETFSKIITISERGNLPPKVQESVDTLARNIGKVIASDLESASPAKIKDTIKQSGLFLEATLKEAAEGKVSRQAIRMAVETDIKAMIGRTLVRVEEEINVLMKRIESQGRKKGAKENTVPAKTVDTPQPKREQVYKLKRVSLSEPVNVKSISPEPAAKASPDPAMTELLRTRDAAKLLREAFNNIELNQLLNASTKEKEGAAQPQALYQIPFFEGQNLQTARVYIRPRKEGDGRADGKKADESRVVFMLNMSRLGPVRVDVDVGAKHVTGFVYVLNDSVARFVKDNLPGLSKPLEEAGYGVRFEVSAADEKFVTEELEKYTPITSRGIVDVKA